MNENENQRTRNEHDRTVEHGHSRVGQSMFSGLPGSSNATQLHSDMRQSMFSGLPGSSNAPQLHSNVDHPTETNFK